MPASLPPRRGQSVDSSDDEKKGPAPPVGGPALSYNLHYIQAENTLVLNILEAKVGILKNDLNLDIFLFVEFEKS